MLFSCRNPFSRGAFVSLAAALLLAGCGSGSGDDSPPPPANSAFPPSSSLAGICTLAGEKAFLRSYMDEVYLWYNEIPAVNPADFNSIPAYMNALLVRTPDAAGLPKDRFSAVLTIEEANALQASALASQRIERARKADLTQLLSSLPGGSVPLSQVVTSPAGRKVGYVLFNDHHEGAQDALIAAIENLKASGVQDLVLDMRFNSGGFLYVAQTAASMVTGPEKEGQVFEQVRFNDKRDGREPRQRIPVFHDREVAGSHLSPRPSPAPAFAAPRLRAEFEPDLLGQRVHRQRPARRRCASRPGRRDHLRQAVRFPAQGQLRLCLLPHRVPGLQCQELRRLHDRLCAHLHRGRRPRASRWAHRKRRC